ncbi:putative amino acid permease YhdG [Pseudoclavibacter triregionum]|nr:putative amino acid permease YhdG [Pseudoclavibacter triregionum]
MRAMGSRWSFIGSWAITGGYVSVVAFEAVALPRTALYLFPELNQIPLWTIADKQVHLTWALVGSIAAVVITIINVIGVRIAGTVQTFVVVFLFAIGALLLAGSFTGGHVEHMQPLFVDGFAGFLAVLVVVPFMFVGFDVIPQTAEEIDLPPRHIGRIAVISVLIAAAWYVMTILTTSSALPIAELEHARLATADAMGRLWGSDFWANVLIAGGIAGIITSWNSLQMGASRLMYSLAHTGMLPPIFGVLHPRFGTPANAVIFIGILAAAAPFFGEAMLGWIVDSGPPAIVIAYLLVSISFLFLRRREPGMERPLRIGGSGRGGEIIGWASVIVCSFLVVLYLPGMPASISVPAWIMFGLWWLIGLIPFLRTPSVPPGPEVEDTLVELARRGRAGRADARSAEAAGRGSGA